MAAKKIKKPDLSRIVPAAPRQKKRKWLDSGTGPNEKVIDALSEALTEAHLCGFSTQNVIEVLIELHKRTEFGKRRKLTARRAFGTGAVIHD